MLSALRTRAAHNRRMPAGLRLRLLGGFQAEVAGTPVAAGEWRRSGATALVKILALHRRLHRDQVTDLLWPDADPALGTGRLHKALHYARNRIDDAIKIVVKMPQASRNHPVAVPASPFGMPPA